MPRGLRIDRHTLWLFDLDNTLHDAGAWVFGELNRAMGGYVERVTGLESEAARQLARQYWHRYGTTLQGLQRHHGVRPRHFLHETHRLPGLEARINGHRHDVAALAALPGRRVILTNAPRDYAQRVLEALGIGHLFEAVLCIEDMAMFGAERYRPKPDARMLRRMAVRLGVAPSRCVLVEDTLVHQKSARRVGMATVWMQRFARRGGVGVPQVARWSMQPAYVDRRVRALRQLR